MYNALLVRMLDGTFCMGNSIHNLIGESPCRARLQVNIRVMIVYNDRI